MSVAVDGSGNVYVTGYTFSSLDGNTNAGGPDMFLAKYDKTGTMQWTRQLGSASVDDSQGVAVDGSGNIYVTGSTLGSLDGNTNAGGSDIFLVKYDPSGTKQWTRQLGSATDDFGLDVAVGGSSNVYVTGYTLDSSMTSQMILIKFDQTGTKQWTSQLRITGSDHGHSVTMDSSGNIYVTGTTTSGLYANIPVADLILVKYDPSGTMQWTRQLGSTDAGGLGVAVDNSGNAYVTGKTFDSLDGNTKFGGPDMFLVKYDPSGTKQWTRQLGSATDDDGQGVAVDRSGNVYVTGSTYGGLDGNTNAGRFDAFLAKYDPSGTKQWTRQLGSATDDFGRGVAVDGSGNIYMTGYTNGGLDKDTLAAGGVDMFLVKYNSSGVNL